MSRYVVRICIIQCKRVGGLHDFEKYELATPNCDRDVATAAWVIKCLANPQSDGAEYVLNAIMERRNQLNGS